MCGILFVTNPKDDSFRERLSTLKPRGPDETNIVVGENYIMGHTRNCITNPMNGKQPIQNENWVLVHNGEIYNAPSLEYSYHSDSDWSDGDLSDNGMRDKTPDYSKKAQNGQSDSNYILTLLKEHGPLETPKHLDGIFAYVAYNVETGEYVAARDPIGVIPMYMAKEDGSVWFSSELKALKGCKNVEIVPPGHVVTADAVERYTTPYATKPERHVDCETEYNGIAWNTLKQSVKKRLHLDVPYGVLLSGGLDSSAIASYIKLIRENEQVKTAWDGTIHTFSIGLEGSPDLRKARRMSIDVESYHHEYIFTVEEGLEALRHVIYAIETYDVTTIRASVPMYLLGKYIRKCGVKVVFSGEGADELFGGYLYNKFCPSAEEMHAECIKKMNRLHYHDCLRANKSMACHGIETRVPFLDKDFVDLIMNKFDPVDKLSHTHPEGKKKTKWYLRSLLRYDNEIPKKILNREKEQFSDGVGNKWIHALKQHAEETVKCFDKAKELYPYQTPQTKEAFLYREIFTELFGKDVDRTVFYTDETCACSSESALKWNDSFVRDPSAKYV